MSFRLVKTGFFESHNFRNQAFFLYKEACATLYNRELEVGPTSDLRIPSDRACLMKDSE